MINHNTRSGLIYLAFLGTVGAVSNIAQTTPVFAQNVIIPDGTLGAEASQRIPFAPIPEIDLIQGGAVRGQNLFHSFEQFNIGEGNGAYFIAPSADTANIFARITGGNPSQILGVLGTRQADLSRSNADLYLINPNGILFGENSALDVGGSFTATTASGVQFGEEGRFSAVDPEAPPSLLTINPSAYFFSQPSTDQIINQSVRQDLIDGTTLGLRVPDGEALSLLGGSVIIQGGNLRANGGIVELGSLQGVGQVNLDANGGFLFPETVDRGSITVSDGARILSIADNGGAISFAGEDISILDSSIVGIGIAGTVDNERGQAGDLTIQATGELTIDSGSLVTNQILTGGFGNAGNLRITASNITVNNQAELFVGNFGNGNTGDISISAQNDIVLENGGRIFNTVQFGATGAGGDIMLAARNLEISNGAQVRASTDGQGNAGAISLIVQDVLLLDGSEANSFISNNIFRNAEGNSGGIEISTGSLLVIDGSQIESKVRGIGNSGDVIISARGDVVFDGRDDLPNGTFLPSAIFTGVSQGGTGSSGNIQISGRNLNVTNRAQISSTTEGNGSAGDIIVHAEDNIYLLNSIIISEVTEETGNGNGGDIILEAKVLELINGSSLLADTENIGDAGNITIRASERVTLSGEGPGANNPEEILPSQISTTVDGQAARGEGGDIDIATGLLSLTDRAFINAGTSGEGRGGDIDIATGVLSLTDRAFISAGTSSEGRGDGGDIYIVSGLLSLTDGAIISSRNSSGATGDAGNLQITGRSIYITNGSQLVSTTEGNGDAGDIIVRAEDNIYLLNSIIISEVTEETGNGNGGDIILEAKVLELINGSALLADTENIGDAGNITIRASERVTLSGEGPGAGNPEEIQPSQISTTVEGQTTRGEGGDIDIATGLLSLTDRAFIDASTSGEGTAGDVRIQTNSLRIEGGAEIAALTISTEDAGTIFITASDEIFISGRDSTGEPSEISGSSLGNATGNGGVLFIVSPRISLLDGALISAISEGPGLAGSINFILDRLEATDSTVATSAIQSQGGDINVNAISSNPKGIIILRGDSDFTTDSLGDGGNINLNAIVIAFDDSDILARSSDALGGNITLGPFLSDTLPIGAISPTENNDRVDVSADGQLAPGTITTSDTSFIQNSLNQLPAMAVDPNALIAGSCIARTAENQGTFVVTGSGGLPSRPGDAIVSTYPTGSVQTLVDAEPQAIWQPGDPIVEPTGVFSLPDGRLVLLPECDEN
jgi:filamentous hemagglutinin family protein